MRRLAAERTAEATASRDPMTYGAIKGALQDNPYESNPLSVLDPKRKQVTDAAMALYPVGMAFNMLPGLGLFKKGKQAAEATKESVGTLDNLANAQMSRRGFLKAASSPLVASAIGETSSFLPPIENLITQAVPVTSVAPVAAAARTIAPLTAAALARVKNTLPHIAARVDRRGFDAFNRADFIEHIKPKDMSTPEFIRSLKTNHPEQYSQMLKDIDRLQNEVRWAGYGHYKTKEEYLDSMSGDTEGLAREARLWDLRKGNVPEPKSYLPEAESIPYKVFEPAIADDILEKLPQSKGGALAQLPTKVKNRLFLPLAGKPIKEAKNLINLMQQTLPVEIAQIKDSRAVTSKMVEHFSQDPEKLLAQAQTIASDKAPKEVMSAFKRFDPDTLVLQNKAQKEFDSLSKLLEYRQQRKNKAVEEADRRFPNGDLMYPPEVLAEIDADLENVLQRHALAKENLEREKAALLEPPAPVPSPEPFWFNSETGAHATMSPEDIHAQKIQDPEYAAKLGVTPEQATAYPVAPEAEPLITGRQTGNRLSLVGMGTPTNETLAATQKMLQEKQYAPEVLDFGGGERLWEGMTPEDLLKAKSLEDLEPFKKYKAGGSVKLPRYSKQHRARQYAAEQKVT